MGSNVAITVSKDHSYVRYERKASFGDGYIMILEGNTKVSGQYVVFKYRTNDSTGGDFWVNTEANGHDNGQASFGYSFKKDEQWHIIVYDLAAQKPAYVQPNDDGDYIIQWSRFDLLDITASTGYIDLGWVMYCENLADAKGVIGTAGQAICQHNVTHVTAACERLCSACGYSFGTFHESANYTFITDNDDKTTTAIMAGTCSLCGEVTRKTAPFLASLSGVSGAESYWAAQGGQALSYGQKMYTYTTGALGYPTAGTLATSNDYKIRVFGWAGTVGKSSGLKYRVVDDEGTELVGWSDVSGTWNLGDAAVQDVVTQKIGADGKGYSFDVKADLSAVSGKTVNVIFAIVASKGVGNDNLIPFITIDNVSVPAAE